MKRTAARLSSDGGDPTPVLPAETVSAGPGRPCPASPAPRGARTAGSARSEVTRSVPAVAAPRAAALRIGGQTVPRHTRRGLLGRGLEPNRGLSGVCPVPSHPREAHG